MTGKVSVDDGWHALQQSGYTAYLMQGLSDRVLISKPQATCTDMFVEEDIDVVTIRFVCLFHSHPNDVVQSSPIVVFQGNAVDDIMRSNRLFDRESQEVLRSAPSPFTNKA